VRAPPTRSWCDHEHGRTSNRGLSYVFRSSGISDCHNEARGGGQRRLRSQRPPAFRSRFRDRPRRVGCWSAGRGCVSGRYRREFHVEASFLCAWHLHLHLQVQEPEAGAEAPHTQPVSRCSLGCRPERSAQRLQRHGELARCTLCVPRSHGGTRRRQPHGAAHPPRRPLGCSPPIGASRCRCTMRRRMRPSTRCTSKTRPASQRTRTSGTRSSAPPTHRSHRRTVAAYSRTHRLVEHRSHRSRQSAYDWPPRSPTA
jgi:hypothetical protein